MRMGMAVVIWKEGDGTVCRSPTMVKMKEMRREGKGERSMKLVWTLKELSKERLTQSSIRFRSACYRAPIVRKRTMMMMISNFFGSEVFSYQLS